MHIGFAIVVGVFSVENFRSSADDNALTPRDDACREIHTFEEDGRFVVAAITIGIFEKTNDSAGLAFAIDSERVIAHLDHPQLAVCAPIESNRVQHERFAGHQFHFEAGTDLNAGERVAGRFGRRLIGGQ